MIEQRARAVEAIAGSLRAALTRPPPEVVSQWAETHRRIVAEDAAEPGRWRNDRTPYLRAPMDASDDPLVRRISMMKMERGGGTEWVLNVLGKRIVRQPGPALWVYPTTVIAEEINRKRIWPTLKKTPAICAEMTGRAWDTRLMDLQLKRMSIAFRGSNAESGLEAMGYVLVIVDELDRCKQGVLDVVHGRGAAHSNFLLIDLGTPELEWSGDPDDKTQGIDRSFKEGDRRRLYVPCPHCRKYHTRRFSDVRWLGGADAKPDAVAEHAWMLCPVDQGGCGAVIQSGHHQWQLARCAWSPEGWTIQTGETIEDAEVKPSCAMVVAPDGRTYQAGGGVYYSTGVSHVSFALHGLYTPFKTNPYGYVAAEYVKNGLTPTREWLNRRIGEGWSTKGQRVEPSDVMRLRGMAWGDGWKKPGPRREWKMGTVPLIDGEGGPEKIVCLTAFCDVQTDRMYVELVGWAADGRTCYLIDYVTLPKRHDDGLASLGPFSLGAWPRVNLHTGEEAAEKFLLGFLTIDSGYSGPEVYDFARPRRRAGWYLRADGKTRIGPMVRPSKGDNEEGPSARTGAGAIRPYQLSTPERMAPGPDGKAGAIRPDSVNLLVINTGVFKRTLFDRLRAELEIENARTTVRKAIEDGKVVPADVLATASRPRTWFFPDDTPKAYFDQLTAEEETLRMVKGRLKKMWGVRPGRRSVGNHALDCRVGNMATMLMWMSERGGRVV